jgi:succinate dehydrogenase/fumarate reductase cytochrome b subunit
MHLVTFIVVGVLLLIAAILFLSGIVNIYQGNEKARNLVSSGFMVGVWGVVIAAILFGFFNL